LIIRSYYPQSLVVAAQAALLPPLSVLPAYPIQQFYLKGRQNLIAFTTFVTDAANMAPHASIIIPSLMNLVHITRKSRRIGQNQ
jgi:hypothetical protein